MRVLYVNQTAQMSGAEHSLLTLITALGDRVDPALACPDGDLADAARDRGIAVHPIRGTDVSLALHPVRTPREMAAMAVDGAKIARLARRRFSLVHANTTRAGLISTMFAGVGARPTIVHVRDWTPASRTSRAVTSYARARASTLICISQFVADEFAPQASGDDVHLVHNPIDVARFDAARVDRDAARSALYLGPNDIAVAVVGQLTPWKGQADAIAAVARLTSTHPTLRMFIVGSAKFQAARLDNEAYARDLNTLPARLGIDDRVQFLGERRDIPEILRAQDILLVPSWKEAFGRIVAEGMAMGVPVIATNVGGPPEIITHDTDGLLAPPRDPAVWAAAIAALADDPIRRHALGAAAAATIRARFTPAHSADRVFSVYKNVLGSP